MEFNGAAVATVLAFSSPAMTAVLAHYLLGEHITAVKIASIVLSLVGTVLVSGAADPAAWKVNAAGITFGLLTGFFFACYNMVGKTSANRSIDPWTTMLYGFSSAIVFLFLFNVATNAFTGQAQLGQFPMAGQLGQRMGDPAAARASDQPWAAYGLYLVSLGYLPATVANLIGALEPVFTGLWAYWFFSELLTGAQLIGSLILLASVVLLRTGEGRRALTA